LLGAAALLAASFPGEAQIERLTLADMVERAEGAIQGVITDRTVFRVDHPVDGPELYFTRLLIEGRSAYDESALAVEVTYHGGFINEREGVYNSEAPSEDDVRTGNRVLAFYKATDNMGGGVAGNALYASHGGLYRIAAGATGAVVLGRGEGYAIENNVRLSSLVRELWRLKQGR
jgi:hypothetical protein